MKKLWKKWRDQTEYHRESLSEIPLHSRVRRFSLWGLPGYIALVLTVVLLLALADVRNDSSDQEQTDQAIAGVAGQTKIADCLNFNRLLVEDQETRELLLALANSAVANSENAPLVREFKALLADFDLTAKENCLRTLKQVEADLGVRIEGQRPLSVRP